MPLSPAPPRYSCCLALIVLEQPTSSLLASNPPTKGRFQWSGSRKQQLIAFALVISFGVVVLLEFG